MLLQHFLPTLQVSGAGQLVATVIGEVKDALIEKAKEKSIETITGLFKLIGRLGGETPKDIRYDESTHTNIFFVGSNNQVHVDQPTTNLYRDQRTRAAVARVASPLRKAGIKALKAKKNEEVLASVGSSDFPELEHDDRSSLSISEAEVPQTLIVRIVKPDFIGDKWSVSEGGRKAYTVTMEDDVFKRRVHAREIGFFDGDMYRVKMLTSQNIDGRGLTTSRKIVEVIEPVPQPRQQLLPSPPPNKPGRKFRDE